MSSQKFNYLTQEGYDRLMADLEHKRSVERPAIQNQIADARDKGDLSENAEYDAALEAQTFLEGRIAKLEVELASARIIDETMVSTDKVQILSSVKLMNHNSGKEVEYTLVSQSEADLKQSKLAIESPIGKALLGKKRGDKVDVMVPAGTIQFEILEIM